MQDSDLTGLVAAGHVIGLHSYSHPTDLDRMASEAQRAEYKANIDHLEGLLASPSPCDVSPLQFLQKLLSSDACYLVDKHLI